MRRLLLTCLLSSTLAFPAVAALSEGEAAPDFSAQASKNGEEFTFSLKDALRKGAVVVYFFPSAYTGGCNVQARTFAVNHEKFAAAGASIIGVSLDDIERLNDFSADPEFCAGAFPIASDAEGQIAQSYDLKVREAASGMKDTRGMEIGHGFAERTTFIVTPDGKVAATVGGVSPTENVAKALQAVEQLAKKKS